MKKYFLPILHFLLLLVAITSFLWLDWMIVVIGFFVYEFQLVLFKGCLLSFWQFGRDNKRPRERFIVFYLKKLFPNFRFERGDFYLDIIIPFSVPILAIIVQVFFGLKPVIEI